MSSRTNVYICIAFVLTLLCIATHATLLALPLKPFVVGDEWALIAVSELNETVGLNAVNRSVSAQFLSGLSTSANTGRSFAYSTDNYDKLSYYGYDHAEWKNQAYTSRVAQFPGSTDQSKIIFRGFYIVAPISRIDTNATSVAMNITIHDHGANNTQVNTQVPFAYGDIHNNTWASNFFASTIRYNDTMEGFDLQFTTRVEHRIDAFYLSPIGLEEPVYGTILNTNAQCESNLNTTIPIKYDTDSMKFVLTIPESVGRLAVNQTVTIFCRDQAVLSTTKNFRPIAFILDPSSPDDDEITYLGLISVANNGLPDNKHKRLVLIALAVVLLVGVVLVAFIIKKLCCKAQPKHDLYQPLNV